MTQIHPEHSPNESVCGNHAPVQQTKVIITERGAIYIIVALAVGMAAWSVARVGYLHDELIRQAADENHRAEQQAAQFMYQATKLQTDYFLHAAEQAQSTEKEIVHYRDQFTSLERQYRMVELKLDDTSVVLHRAGLQIPGDYTRGPQGALDAEAFHVSQKGKWAMKMMPQPYQQQQGAGGIIQNHAKVLLIALTDPSIYHCLSPGDKATVDAIDAKDPMSRTQHEVDTLYDILGVCRTDHRIP